MTLGGSDIAKAYDRIAPYLRRTPLYQSSMLNHALSNKIIFKAEHMQTVGAFKARGALNTLLWSLETDRVEKDILAISSGNHAQGVAWSASRFGKRAKIYMAKDASPLKVAATRAYGAEVVLCENRRDAEQAVFEELRSGNKLFIPPYDHDQVICGQGTAAWEVFDDYRDPIDAIFVPVGGGGLLSGTLIAARGRSHTCKVFGAEPVQANDAARSYHSGEIVRYETTPDTICDGVRTLSVSERTFHHIKKSDGIYEISEEEVCIATQWLTHLLKATVEPTSSLAFVAAVKWLRGKSGQTACVILSGGNIDHSSRTKIYQHDYLGEIKLENFKTSLEGFLYAK